METIISLSQHTPLCTIMGNNKSDKGSSDITKSHHNYTVLYYNLFNKMREEKLKIFELGIGTNNTTIQSNMGANGRPGASLYGWSEFFPNSLVYGADIDKNILFNTETIKTYFCDQTDSTSIKNMWKYFSLENDIAFDIIIEDGLHTFDANVCFFENSIFKLKRGGYFIIEDIHKNDIQRFNNIIQNSWCKMYPDLEFCLIELPSLNNQSDNNVLVIFYKDFNSENNENHRPVCKSWNFSL